MKTVDFFKPKNGYLHEGGVLCVAVKICFISPETENLVVTRLSRPLSIVVRLCVRRSQMCYENVVLVETALSARTGLF